LTTACSAARKLWRARSVVCALRPPAHHAAPRRLGGGAAARIAPSHAAMAPSSPPLLFSVAPGVLACFAQRPHATYACDATLLSCAPVRSRCARAYLCVRHLACAHANRAPHLRRAARRRQCAALRCVCPGDAAPRWRRWLARSQRTRAPAGALCWLPCAHAHAASDAQKGLPRLLPPKTTHACANNSAACAARCAGATRTRRCWRRLPRARHVRPCCGWGAWRRARLTAAAQTRTLRRSRRAGCS
jgi:hypothetical protein